MNRPGFTGERVWFNSRAAFTYRPGVAFLHKLQVVNSALRHQFVTAFHHAIGLTFKEGEFSKHVRL